MAEYIQTKFSMESEALDLYIRQEGLDKLIDFNVNKDFKEGVFDAVSGKLKIPFPPVKDDLVRLHKLIREKKFMTVLEFGVGYSTLVIADALKKNEQDFEKLTPRPVLRNHHLFQLFSLDANRKWLDEMKQNLPESLKDRIHLSFSSVKIGLWRDQVCHFYEKLPDIIPDFIYLDGPSPKDVQGDIHGMTFQCDERTVMSGDLLWMESTMLPGTFILVDGRTNNVRFLKRNFTRDFKFNYSKEHDFSTFELDEERLGKYNILGSDLFK